MPGTFYVYEHWRPDTNVCFYVGKGTRKRAFKIDRRCHNLHHANILKRLAKLGLLIEVRCVATGLSEAEAFSLEVDRIAFWRSSGAELVNKTNGGEGSAGHIQPPYTPEQLAKLKTAMVRVALARPPMRADTKTKIAANIADKWQDEAYRGRLTAAHVGKKASEETKAAMREAQAARGPTRPEEHKARIAASVKARHAAKKALGLDTYNGKPRSPESKARMSAAAKARYARERAAKDPPE